MGVPKFFKYISERYPCLSEKIKEHQVPEFDNLYLDMNGIIHTCSHPNDADVKFRITEETIFKNIFHYIEILFRIIQPKKLFFLAVDGVAPRAKINQQRSRRFRSAKEAELLELKAKNQGIELPKEARFDSNCITPGTDFMAKLNKQLQYFISYKISTDKHWHNCKVILSGSEVPGEGEHKIMDYIRYMKSQPDYDSNTRHCLYGLDADLIMLGLCTHEPHFTLLREEVLFGKQQKVILTPEETNFCLLHLSLMRNYLEHEFSAVKEKLSFEFDIEKIIDDWVLLGFLVGNDFIPHLPNFHIAKGILEILYQAYMDVLPTLDGYINEAGTLNLSRFEKFMVKLSEIDHQHYEEMYEDLKYLEGKSVERNLEPFECDSPDKEVPKKRVNKDLEALINDTDELMLQSDEEENSDEELINSFTQHKKYYYMNKLEYKNVDAEVLRSQAEGYVRAIQWNLNYYYNGCSSWSWYYPHHYAPYISDVKGFKSLKLEFDLGEPFLPFQQLLAVLPAASKGLLPKAYQDLLVEEKSPIIQYYPPEFMTDLNGKQNDWEAVVLIPFIQEDTLLKAMKPGNDKLEDDEKQRNKHGPMCVFTYQDTSKGDYKAPEYFPTFVNHAKMELVNRDEILVPKENLRKGLCPGVRLDLHFPGFPTLKHIDHTAKLLQAKVKVFERASKEQSMILYVTPKPKPNLEALSKRLLGNAVFVGWPHFFEAKVVAVSDESVKYQFQLSNIVKEDMKHLDTAAWLVQKKSILENHKTRMGIELGDVEILVHACPIIGRKYIYGSHCKVTLEKIFSPNVAFYPLQTVVENLSVYDPTFVQYSSLQEIFSPGTVIFMLGHPHYGEMGKVDEIVDKKSGRIRVTLQLPSEPDLHDIKQLEFKTSQHFMYGGIAAQHLGISSHLLSRITGTIFVVDHEFNHNEKSNKFNFGLNLKFNKKNAEVKGYTKKVNGQWLYSTKSIDLIREYMNKCPELFEKLDKTLDAEVFTVNELFPRGSDQMREVLDWLKEQQKKCNLTPRSCGEEELDSEVVAKLEEEIDKFSFVGCTAVLQVKPHLLFKPGLNDKTFQPDSEAVHKMFDRIIIVKEGFTVPLGSKGTIIGIQKAENPMDSMYTVLFDKCFEGGMLSPATQKHRVYRVTVTDFINCSHGWRVNDKTYRVAKKIDRIKKEKELQEARQTLPNAWQVDQQRNIPNNDLPPHPMDFPKFFQQKNKPAPNTNNPQNSKHPKPNLAAPSAKELPKFNKFQGQEKKGKKVDQNTEFQALWNECHKASVKTQSPKKTPNLPINPVASVTNVQQVTQPKAQVNTQSFPQDPSAFLKAMLKISDDSGAPASQPTKIIPSQAPNASDAPPLVQQLFDNARKAEKLKNQQRQLQQAMQGQMYNPQMKPIDVVMGNQNRHPAQNFAAPPMPMPAPPPKQWINQNAHAQNRPMPRPNFPLAQQQQQPPMYPIPPPKWAMPAMRPPPPHVRPYFFNPRNGPLPMPQMDKPNMRPPFPHLAQMAQQMNTQAPKVEQEPRLKNTPFVPLQAEKKRNPKSQQHRQKKETEQKESVKNPTVASPVVAVSKEIPENAATVPVEKQEPSANTQRKNTNRRKKSRLAANFGNAAVQNGAGSQ